MEIAALSALLAAACGHGNSSAVAASDSVSSPRSAAAAAPSAANATPTIAPEDKAPPASQTGGFDGQKAYDYTGKLVSFGPTFSIFSTMPTSATRA